MVNKESTVTTLSAYDLYVVVTYGSYSDPSCSLDKIYTDKAEAEKARDDENRSWEKHKSSLKSEVMTLNDWFSEAKQNAYINGQIAERDSNSL
jgi:hypothetical protein